MWKSGWPLRACGTLGAASALSGCAGEAGPWLFGGMALVLCTAAAGAAGWLLGRHGLRQRLHLARQATRLLGELSGGSVWQVQGQPPRLDDGRRFDEVYDGGDRSPQIEAQLGREEPFGPCMLRRRDGGPAEELSALPWYRDDGCFGGQLGLVRSARAGGAPEGHQGLALQALAEAWPQVLMLLQRRADDEPWQRLQASPQALRQFGDAPLIATGDLQAQLPAALHLTLAAPGDAEGDGWRLRHLRGEGPSGAPAMLLLWRAGDGQGDETASLSYTVSHDLRAPIRVVEGFARILKEDYSATLDRVAVGHLERVLGAAARMNLMIDAMLTLARLSSQPLTRQPVNLSQLATYVIDDLRRAAPEREAVIQIDPDLQTSGDPTLLRLVLENLLGNAWKYTAKRGQAHIVFGRETVDGHAAYVVRDNGAGFDMRSAERLFGLFQRLHSASDFPGTGVGLASVRRIVQRHGGEIWADGEPGRGAAFYFRLRD